ncbi:MAG TPA: DUF4157 domain-containing protein [Ktedonobacteraceae bacterium]|nr:DUF4157 domain-containing protein [Ktedonobacteraceae bacterium]
MSEQVIAQMRSQPVQVRSTAHSVLQRCSNGVECAECKAKREQHEGKLQRAAVNAAPALANGVPPVVHSVLNSPGHTLDSGTRSFMEPRFGHNFSGVRVHTDSRAAESARSVNALAYTVGQHVAFGQGQYKPDTLAGKQLLAHELTHTIQQSMGQASAINRASALQISEPHDSYEHEADARVRQVMAGATTNRVYQQVQVGAVTPLHRQILQRQEDDPKAQEKEKPKKSTIPTIPIPVFDEFDPMIIVPDVVPGIGGSTMKLSDLRKAVDVLQGKQSITKQGPGFCEKFGMEEAQFGDVKGLCCPKYIRSKEKCCSYKNLDLLQARCCTPQEIQFQGRCIKPQPVPSTPVSPFPLKPQPGSPSPQKSLPGSLPPPQSSGPVAAHQSLVIDHFIVDKDTIPNGFDAQLDHVALLLKASPEMEVYIEGYTDSTFTADYNTALSKRRAASVKRALIDRGVKAAHLHVEGFGEEHLLFPAEKTEEEKARNRRVEIRF